MKFTDLEPQFVRYESRQNEEVAGKVDQHMIHVPDLAHAQGIIFLCPTCFAKNAGPIGTHAIEVTFVDRGAQDHQGSHNSKGEPSRWQVAGFGYDDLTLHPSIDAGDWHGFIKGGQVQ